MDQINKLANTFLAILVMCTATEKIVDANVKTLVEQEASLQKILQHNYRNMVK